MALGWLLFGKGDRHLTAEMLYEEATHAKVPVSLATVYNTLNQLTEAGLLRQVSVDGTKTYFDTNVTSHHHYYLEGSHELVDIPDPQLVLQKMPDVPEGFEISRIDMVVPRPGPRLSACRLPRLAAMNVLAIQRPRPDPPGPASRPRNGRLPTWPFSSAVRPLP